MKLIRPVVAVRRQRLASEYTIANRAWAIRIRSYLLRASAWRRTGNGSERSLQRAHWSPLYIEVLTCYNTIIKSTKLSSIDQSLAWSKSFLRRTNSITLRNLAPGRIQSGRNCCKALQLMADNTERYAICSIQGRNHCQRLGSMCGSWCLNRSSRKEFSMLSSGLLCVEPLQVRKETSSSGKQ